jgi:preprotein translocase SecF subunit
VFHLTRYRYLFFLISGIIIVPGLLALFFWHLNLGIDFTAGSSIDLRFQSAKVDQTTVMRAFTSAGAQDVELLVAHQFGADVAKPDQYAFIEFSRPIGPNFEKQVLALLTDPKAKLPPVHADNGTPSFAHIDSILNTTQGQRAQLVVLFDKPVSADAVTAALKNLPQTDEPTSAAGGNGSVGAASPTASPAATATATPKGTATATPGATATPTATPSSNTAGQTFPVSITGLTIGQSDLIYTINTQTDLINTPQANTKGPRLEQIVAQLQHQYGPVYVEQSNVIDPTIASEQTLMAILAVAVASLFILIYIAIAFRHVGSLRLSLRFGASAVIALLHDALVVLGLWAIFGRIFDFKVDTLFVTAVLTVIGFSVHDTIVVFDRIRENLARHTVESFNTVVNTSLLQTMSRSLNTSLTVLLVLSAQVLFGGASTREFVLALLIGIASGTYSSIFNASMILSVWQNQEYKHWFRGGKGGTKAVAPSAEQPRPVAGVRA